MAYTVKDISKVAFINTEGFIKIESILYQYKGNLIKYMINGTIQDCNLLNSTNETNENLEIIVNKVPEGGEGGIGDHGEGGEGDHGEGGDPFYKKASAKSGDANSPWILSGSCRAKCTTYVEIKGHGYPNNYEYTFQLDCKQLIITIDSQRKNGWGNWIQYHGEYNVSGMTSVTIAEGINGTQPTNPYYPDFMINFQTIHGNTNSNFFPVTINKNMVYYHGIVWTSVLSKVFYCPSYINPIHFDITADIAGGAHGITAQNNFQ